jgi:hypothetical protein
MKSTYIIGAIIVVIVGIGAAVLLHKPASVTPLTAPSYANATTSAPAASAPSAAPAATPAPGAAVYVQATVAPAAPAPKSFTVNGNDETADVKTITVTKGTPVTITFGADAGTTYHGGLDFRSSVLNTGTIAPGSTKTISFTADKSFAFTPYWPSTNIAKPYTISVVVE